MTFTEARLVKLSANVDATRHNRNSLRELFASTIDVVGSEEFLLELLNSGADFTIFLFPLVFFRVMSPSTSLVNTDKLIAVFIGRRRGICKDSGGSSGTVVVGLRFDPTELTSALETLLVDTMDRSIAIGGIRDGSSHLGGVESLVGHVACDNNGVKFRAQEDEDEVG